MVNRTFYNRINFSACLLINLKENEQFHVTEKHSFTFNVNVILNERWYRFEYINYIQQQQKSFVTELLFYKFRQIRLKEKINKNTRETETSEI